MWKYHVRRARVRVERAGGGGGGGTRNIISAPYAECAIALSSTSSSSGQTIVSTTEINKESGTSIECSLQDYVESSIIIDLSCRF